LAIEIITFYKGITMKRISLYLFLINCLIHFSVSAQVSITVNIINPTPTYLSDWNNSRAGLAIVLLNSAGQQETGLVKFRTQLLNSKGDVIAISNDGSARVYTIRSGATTFTLEKVLQLENLQFSDRVVANKIQTSGKLPVDNYWLKVQLLSGVNNSELTKVDGNGTQFRQISYQLPYLLTPNDKSWLDANISQSVITFRWSSLIPMSREPVIYRLQVFEVLDGQQSMQALRANQPILSIDVRGTTQYFWRPQLSFKEARGRIFIWTVQTLDAKGTPISTIDENTEGRSEPRVFGVCDKLNHQKEDPGEDCAAGRKL
jgi:hypothetical protein